MPTSAATWPIIFVIASLLVAAMAAHYVWRAGRRHDLLCFLGLVGAQLGLLQSGRAAEGASNIFSVVGPGFGCFASPTPSGKWVFGAFARRPDSNRQ